MKHHPPRPRWRGGCSRSARLPLAEAYAGWLADAGTVRGLIGPREVPRLWERHLLNCAVLADAIPEGAAVCDLGLGRRAARVWCWPSPVRTSGSPWSSRCCAGPRFLDEVVTDLGLGSVEVLRGRAEDLHGERTFDVVTSRAVAPLERLLAWSMPLVAPDGALVAMKGSSIGAEIEVARPVLERFRCAEPQVLELGGDRLPTPTTVVRVAWSDPGRVGWPLAPSPAPRSSRSRRRR